MTYFRLHPRPLLSIVGTLIVAFLSITFPAGSAMAADGPSITWSVRPADSTGPDGRAWVEQELDPGEAAGEHLAISNLSAETVTFRLAAADGYFTPAGRFNMLPSNRDSVAAGTWIDVTDTVTVNPGATAIVPFTVTVPTSAEPGDHAAGLAASLLSTKEGDNSASVGVESRIGFRVMTRVTGELRPQLELENVKATYALSWNPFTPGELLISGDAVNTGNVRLHVDGQGRTGQNTVSLEGAEGGQELLPGDRRKVTTLIGDAWPTLYIEASLRMDPTVVALNGSRSALAAVTSTTGVWAIPWSHLLVLTGLLLAAFAVVGGRKKARRRTSALIEAARNEGRRSALPRAAEQPGQDNESGPPDSPAPLPHADSRNNQSKVHRHQCKEEQEEETTHEL
ncbi:MULTISPECIES: hypothetical protein [unclassified Arthrobacter]|uniref:hypothetical protein n=1 Tax=unclassified Arthrobacter TaxID=235627 RepID=UPI002882F70C|nr:MULTISPECIES: hypothetical protein [unclassified Arthrobacter]